jgi:o-succinylbenzoate---CoA ligase
VGRWGGGGAARHLVPVPAAALTLDLVRAALDGEAPLAVLPHGPPAVVDRARAALCPDTPLEAGTDLVVVTSGTTGNGRAVLLPAAAVRASARATEARLGGPGTWLLVLPTSSIAGLQVLCRSVLAGTAPVVLDREEALAAAVRRLPEGRRYASLVPTQLHRFLEREPDALRAFDGILVGGAGIDPALLHRVRAEGIAVVPTYGMTETAGGCVYDGVPLDGVQVRLGDDGGVEVSGPVLAAGYRLDPVGTAAAFRDGWFVTRDAGSIDADGRLTVHGRLDDVLVTGGVNVAPAAVEAVLREHPDVDDAIVFGRPDDEWGQRVVAAVVPAAGCEPDLRTLRPFVTERLGGPAAPRELHLLATVPLLHSGKPDRGGVARAIRGRAG